MATKTKTPARKAAPRKAAAKAKAAPRKAAAPKREVKTLTLAELNSYLKAEVSETGVGTPEFPQPYVNANGRLFIHTRHLTRWAKGHTATDVQTTLRELGFVHRATVVPGFEGKRSAFYVSPKGGVPKGVTVKGLPVRKLEAAAK